MELNDFNFDYDEDLLNEQLEIFLSSHYFSKNLLILSGSKKPGISKKSVKLIEAYLAKI